MEKFQDITLPINFVLPTLIRLIASVDLVFLFFSNQLLLSVEKLGKLKLIFQKFSQLNKFNYHTVICRNDQIIYSNHLSS